MSLMECPQNFVKYQMSVHTSNIYNIKLVIRQKNNKNLPPPGLAAELIQSFKNHWNFLNVKHCNRYATDQHQLFGLLSAIQSLYYIA